MPKNLHGEMLVVLVVCYYCRCECYGHGARCIVNQQSTSCQCTHNTEGTMVRLISIHNISAMHIVAACSVKDVSHYSMTSHGDKEQPPMVIPVKAVTATTMQHLATMIEMSTAFLIAMTWVVVEYVIVLTTPADKIVIPVYSSSIDLLAVIHLQQMHVFHVTVIQLAQQMMGTV